MSDDSNAAAPPMIEFSHVNKNYGGYRALIDINAQVQKGEVVVVCGPSGSGKSTLIRTVNRLEEIQSGTLMFDGQNVHAKMNSKTLNQIRSRIGSCISELQPVSAHVRAGQHHVLADPPAGPQGRRGA